MPLRFDSSGWIGLFSITRFIKLKHELITIAHEGNYNMMVYTVNPAAHSNRYSLAHIMRIDMEDKPIIRLKNIWFPEGAYFIGRVVVMWSDSKVEIPLDCERYTSRMSDSFKFVS